MNQQELGAALRALRVASGKKAETVARGAVVSPSKLSRIENGRVPPSLADVDGILTAIGVSDEVKQEYMAAARAVRTELTAWRLYRRLGYHRMQQQARALEAKTRVMRLFQPALIPGLLQTPEYARAVLGRKPLSEEVRQRAVGVRLERQHILHDADKSLRFVITESVLRWRIIPPSMMAEQLDRIISVSRLPHVDVRTVPLEQAQTDFPSHSFVIWDDRLVTAELVHGEVVVTEPQDVALYVEKFEAFAARALCGDAMRAFAATIRDDFLQEQESD